MEGLKLKIKVMDENLKDVTSERDWYIDTNGNLYFETNDIDCPLMEAEGYCYQVEDIR